MDIKQRFLIIFAITLDYIIITEIYIYIYILYNYIYILYNYSLHFIIRLKII